MHRLYDYLTPTLTPDDTLLGADVAAAEWWLYVKPEFDNIIWQYYEDRVIFMNHKFPVMDTETTYSNILRTFAINLRSKARQYERLYNVIMKDYEPLWNLDSVQGIISEDDHTGTDSTAKTGTDTSALTGTDTLTHSGSDIDTLSGSDGHSHSITKDDHTKTGSETLAVTGNDTNTKEVATFDSAASQTPYLPSEKDTVGHGKTDTHTYNNIKDAHELTESSNDTFGKVDTLQHGHVETTLHGKTDTMTHNTLDTLTRNLKDKHAELIIRQGNQGVTKSQEMLLDEINAWSNELTNFIKYVVRDCVNQCTYAVEGV